MAGSQETRFTSMADALETINEELADACTDLLRDAMAGNPSAQKIEREVQKARRSVAKAEQVLRGINRSEDD